MLTLRLPGSSSKPVAGHAVPGPLCLTDPAPVEAAARLAADHVHAAPVPLGRRPAHVGSRIIRTVGTKLQIVVFSIHLLSVPFLESK